ncbi:hypothetical protein KC722_02005 [Candidatus Kaiserbacteria bacterium]|nr:hypothetical protein [Candidatus Kaiserbacteria bacterium]MCB9811306.1 hypothetical protein [Candidatus Nomurabacteria bacterium]
MENTENKQLKEAIAENAKLIEQNNKLLRKIYRQNVWGMWLRVVWYAALIGLPFALYFYVLEPYFAALGSSYETFSAGIQEIPGFKQFNETLRQHKGE